MCLWLFMSPPRCAAAFVAVRSNQTVSSGWVRPGYDVVWPAKNRPCLSELARRFFSSEVSLRCRTAHHCRRRLLEQNAMLRWRNGPAHAAAHKIFDVWVIVVMPKLICGRAWQAEHKVGRIFVIHECQACPRSDTPSLVALVVKCS